VRNAQAQNDGMAASFHLAGLYVLQFAIFSSTTLLHQPFQLPFSQLPLQQL
jgi:hypothetical protein